VRARFLLLVASSACASLSGLDTLEVVDGGGVDAQLDVAPDIVTTDANDASVNEGGDAAIDAPVDVIDAGTTSVPCGTTDTCSGQTPVCCVTVEATWSYQCVTAVSSCTGPSQFAQTCAHSAACGTGMICCGVPGGPANPNAQCTGFATPSKVSCASTCTQGNFEVGCNVQQQNCANKAQTCAVSTCTLPNQTVCK
jgi:hypothetical protein